MADSKIEKPYDGTQIPRYYQEYLIWDSTNNCYPVTIVPSTNQQLVCVVRNLSNGAIYACWYNRGIPGFEIGATLSGSTPTNGQKAYFEYLIK